MNGLLHRGNINVQHALYSFSINLEFFRLKVFIQSKCKSNHTSINSFGFDLPNEIFNQIIDMQNHSISLWVDSVKFCRVEVLDQTTSSSNAEIKFIWSLVKCWWNLTSWTTRLCFHQFSGNLPKLLEVVCSL